MKYYATYDKLNKVMDGILHTNMQNGRGYAYFEDLDLVLLVECTENTFVAKGKKIAVNFQDKDEFVQREEDMNENVQEPEDFFHEVSWCKFLWHKVWRLFRRGRFNENMPEGTLKQVKKRRLEKNSRVLCKHEKNNKVF